MRTLIRNASIFDGSGSPPFMGAVIIDEDRIAKVLRASESTDGFGADRVIDAGGRTLMPGLVDAHTHLTWGSSVEHIYHQFILPPDELKAAAWRNARVLLDHGFTSAYSAGALVEGIEPELAQAIEAGETPGPRLVPSTIERSPEGEEGVDTGNVFNGRGADAMRAFVAHCSDTGVRSIKLVISGEDALKPGSSKDIMYERDELLAGGEAAREAGLWIACHAYWPEAINLALDAGARIIYHGSFADEATIDRMVAEKDRFFYAPGPGVSVAALEANPPPHVDMSAMKASAAQRLELEAKIVPELARRGVRVLIGGDYGFPFNPNGTNARDLLHFVKYFGFSPAEALVSATRFGGELMGLDVGQIKAGYFADLLLVDGDPLADLGVLLDKKHLSLVMKGGSVHKLASELAA